MKLVPRYTKKKKKKKTQGNVRQRNVCQTGELLWQNEKHLATKSNESKVIIDVAAASALRSYDSCVIELA